MTLSLIGYHPAELDLSHQKLTTDLTGQNLYWKQEKLADILVGLCKSLQESVLMMYDIIMCDHVRFVG